MKPTNPCPVNRRIAALIATMALGLVVAGCGGNGNSDSGGGSDQTQSASPTKQSPTESATSPDRTSDSAEHGASSGRNRGLLAAGETALKKVGRGTVISIDSERGGTVWEVQVATAGGVEHEVNVSKNGKKVLSGPRTKKGDAEDKAENRREVEGAKLDFRAAARKVLAIRNGKITELNLDDHRDRIVWESDVHDGGTKYEIKIDAESGKAVKNKPSSSDDDDDD